MTKFIAAAIALLCLVPLAACGDDDSGALSKAEFIEQGDAVCGGLTKSTGAIAEPTSNEEVSAYLTDTIALAKEARADMAALTPPADGEDIHQALLDAIDGAIAAAEEAVAAADEGDFEKMTALLDDASTAGDEADADADAYGFKECGSGGDS